MDTSTQRNANSSLTWVTLVIAVVALILAWTAYNRAGVDLEDQIQREVGEAVIEADQELDEAALEAEIKLDEAEREARDGTADTLEAGANALDRGAADVRTDGDAE